MSDVIDATKDDFDDIVAEGVTLVDVWGPQCQPCLALAPHVETIAAAKPDLRVVKLDASQARRLCMSRRVMGLPTFLLLRDGEEVARVGGQDLDAAKLDAWLEEQLNLIDETQEA